MRTPRRRCGEMYVTGGPDPYSTECDLEPHGAEVAHRGPDPLGEPDWRGYVEWRGGGTAGGDPLPYRDVRWVSPEEISKQRQDELMAALDASVQRAREQHRRDAS